MSLTAATISAAKTGDVLNDTLVVGLHVRALPKGKIFYLYFRTKDGTQRRPKLGACSVLTLAQARQIAKDMLHIVASGRDPMIERQTRKDAPLVNELADRYWKRHGEKQKSKKDIERHLDAHIRPLLGSERVIDIGYKQCEKLFDRVAKTAPVQANRVISTFSKMLTLAERWEWRPMGSNPCKRVQRTPETKRRRKMEGSEAPRIAVALTQHAKDAPQGVAFLYLLILSGARKGEIAAADWSMLHENVLKLPDSKTGYRLIFLPPVVMELLEKLPRTVDHAGNPSGSITGIKDPTKIWHSVRKEAGCPDLWIHDLRRSFASAALSAGLTLAQVGELLGHKNAQTTKGYAYLMEEAATAAVATVADKLQEMMRAKVVTPSDPVAPA